MTSTIKLEIEINNKETVTINPPNGASETVKVEDLPDIVGFLARQQEETA